MRGLPLDYTHGEKIGAHTCVYTRVPFICELRSVVLFLLKETFDAIDYC